MHGFNLLSYPDLHAVDFLHHSHSHITLAVTRKVEVLASCFYLPVHISTVLAEALLQALAGLTNILHGAVCNSTTNGITDVGGVAVHGRVQVNLIAGGSGLEGLSWLDIGAC